MEFRDKEKNFLYFEELAKFLRKLFWESPMISLVVVPQKIHSAYVIREILE